MNVLDSSRRLVDVLSEWGLREARKYPKIEIPSDPGERTVAGLEVVLRHVPELIARILLAEPLDVESPRGVLRVEFGPEEKDDLYLHNGVPLAAFLDRISQGQTVDYPGPVVCTVLVARDDTDKRVGRVVIFDGWHRARDWFRRAQAGAPERLTADLIKTRRPLVPAGIGARRP